MARRAFATGRATYLCFLRACRSRACSHYRASEMAALGHSARFSRAHPRLCHTGLRRLYRLRRWKDSASRVPQCSSAAEERRSERALGADRIIVTIDLDRAERRVEEHSDALKKPLGLRDLVLTQILFVVGWGGGQARPGSPFLLVACDRALLHSAGRGRNLFEQSNAPRRRHLSMGRSEERRVGKECRSRWSP